MFAGFLVQNLIFPNNLLSGLRDEMRGRNKNGIMRSAGTVKLLEPLYCSFHNLLPQMGSNSGTNAGMA